MLTQTLRLLLPLFLWSSAVRSLLLLFLWSAAVGCLALAGNTSDIKLMGVQLCCRRAILLLARSIELMGVQVCCG